MKNPLRKRLPRELKSEFGKYFVIFFLMFATIGLVSGYLVAGSSMVAATMRPLRNITSKTETCVWQRKRTRL